MSTAAASTTSTGPRTPEGKAISSQNALKHGLTSKSPVLPSEDPAEYQAFVQMQMDAWQPQGSDQHAAVLEYADICWRLQRVAVQEAKLIAIEVLRMQIDRKNDDDLNTLLLALGPSDPVALEALAVDRLFKSRTLTNLHRHERSLNRLREKAFEKLASHARLVSERQSVHERRQRQEPNLATQVVQNELPTGPGSSTENCLQMPLRA